MNKGELIEKLAKDVQLSKAQANNVIDSALGAITQDLKKGGTVVFVGFGTFKVSARKARSGRNPQTGEKIKIAAAKVVRFSAGAALKKTVNKGK